MPCIQFKACPIAEPTVLDKGGKRQIQFSGFKRYAGDSPLTVSADFVRANPPTP
jgi:hypothetical protein